LKVKIDEELKLINEFIMVDIDGNSQVKIACYFIGCDRNMMLKKHFYMPKHRLGINSKAQS